jgi:carotenoid cleavage dioxygenase-like enzyme
VSLLLKARLLRYKWNVVTKKAGNSLNKIIDEGTVVGLTYDISSARSQIYLSDSQKVESIEKESSCLK